MKFSLLMSLFFSVLASEATNVQLPLQLPDQHDVQVTTSESTKWILFASDMNGYKMTRDTLEKLKITDLAPLELHFVADISGMPSLISKMFAMPKMKKLPYQILLDREAKVTAHWPKKEEQLTLMKIEGSKVVDLKFLSTEVEVKALFESGLN